MGVKQNITNVILSLASNVRQEENIIMAEERLQSLFSAISFSRMMRTEAIGVSVSKEYINVIATGSTRLEYDALKAAIKALEHDMGRTEKGKHDGMIPIDIDIMQYGGQRYKADDWHKPFNVILLKEMEAESK